MYTANPLIFLSHDEKIKKMCVKRLNSLLDTLPDVFTAVYSLGELKKREEASNQSKRLLKRIRRLRNLINQA